MIRFDQVHKRYPTGREALAGVSFSIGHGELAFLTGPSGAGKSSVLKLIALIERPTRGQIFINTKILLGSNRAAFRSSAAAWAWYSKTTNCCTTAPSRTMWRCR